MTNLIQHLQSNNPDIRFVHSSQFSWSHRKNQVSYASLSKEEDGWSLLHEVGHALLGHTTYATDIELLKKEVAAWQKAAAIAVTYNIKIDEEFIEDCLDSYRDWLFKRSTCPSCRVQGVQKTPEQYSCLNCKSTWVVTKSRFCRPYRRSK